MIKERLNTYTQHIQQPELQQKEVKGPKITCGGGNIKIMLLFSIWEDNKTLRGSNETSFIEK